MVAVHTVHDKMSEAQDDNSAVEGARDKSELLAEEEAYGFQRKCRKRGECHPEVL